MGRYQQLFKHAVSKRNLKGWNLIGLQLTRRMAQKESGLAKENAITLQARRIANSGCSHVRSDILLKYPMPERIVLNTSSFC
jgi:hypothetical protein